MHVLERFERELASVRVAVGSASPRPGLIRVVLVCGSDLLQSMTELRHDGSPVWRAADVETVRPCPSTLL